jgi:hypothetical protein
VERELIAILAESSDWPGIPLHVGPIHLATNRVSIELLRSDEEMAPLQFEFQERAGWVLVSILHEGWMAHLPPAEREILWRALAGLFKTAGVDILLQDLVRFAGFETNWYDVAPDGILFWPQPQQHVAVLYRLRNTGVENPWPVPIRAVVEPSLLERPQLLFRETPLAWNDWVEMWNGSAEILPLSTREPVSAPGDN